MSEIITGPSSESEEAQEISFIRGIAAAEGYNPDDVLPETIGVSHSEESESESVEEEAPALPPEIDPAIQFKKRHAQREARKAQSSTPVPAPAPAPPTPQQPQQPQQPSPFVDLGPEPSLEKDPAAHVKWMRAKQKQDGAIIQALVYERVRESQQENQRRQMAAVHEQQTAWVHDVGRAEQEWIAQHPDYSSKYSAVKQGLAEVYSEQGISKAKVEALVKSEMHGMARLAYDEGVHPCQMVESLHRRMFSGSSPAPRARTASGQFSVARAAKAAGEGVNMSSSNATQVGELTPSQIRTGGASQAQIQNTLTKIGTKGMLGLLEAAERGQ